LDLAEQVVGQDFLLLAQMALLITAVTVEMAAVVAVVLLLAG
jgi:hypothetical protein